MGLKFTGEFWIPGATPKRIEEDHVERYRFASQFVKRKTVLDIACGVGYGSKILMQAGALRVDGVDISEELIGHARCNYKMENIRFLVGDVCSYKADVSYDIIICLETIEHLKDYNKALSTIYSLLRKDGLLIISSPNRLITSPDAKSIKTNPDNKFHIREFTIEELGSLLRGHDFEIYESDIFGQRQQRYFKNRYLQRIYKNIFSPDALSSPVVTRVGKRMPRYFIIIARKTDV
jgi:SAM-dependent methyltransferase